MVGREYHYTKYKLLVSKIINELLLKSQYLYVYNEKFEKSKFKKKKRDFFFNLFIVAGNKARLDSTSVKG